MRSTLVHIILNLPVVLHGGDTLPPPNNNAQQFHVAPINFAFVSSWFGVSNDQRLKNHSISTPPEEKHIKHHKTTTTSYIPYII